MTAPLTSSFTAINGLQAQLCTPPQSSASLPILQKVRQRVSTKRRRRNPTVAQYLGLGPSSESNHLEQNVSASNQTRGPHIASTSKLHKLGNKNEVTYQHTELGNRSSFSQTRVSDSLRVKKPRHSSTASLKPFHGEPSTSSTAAKQDTGAHAVYSVEVKSWLRTPDDHAVTPVHDSSEIGCGVDLADHINQIESCSGDWVFDDDDEAFNDDLNDEEFLELTSQIVDPSDQTTELPSSPCGSDSTHTVDNGDEERPNLTLKPPVSPEKHVGSSERSSKKFVSPMTLTSRLLASTGDIGCAEARKPIARAPFPEAVRDRSPIIGLSSDTLLRTCFRVGEAINQAHHSSKHGKHAVFELYARILESSRDDTKQLFTFCDLFHGKPPYVKGLYDGGSWRSVQLFDYDSKRLLQQGRICRCMGTMKRDGKDWVLEVLSIWEATWDDIKWVEGIVNA